MRYILWNNELLESVAQESQWACSKTCIRKRVISSVNRKPDTVSKQIMTMII